MYIYIYTYIYTYIHIYIAPIAGAQKTFSSIAAKQRHALGWREEGGSFKFGLTFKGALQLLINRYG